MLSTSVDNLLSTLERRIDERKLTLPVLPHVSSQVMRLVNDPDSDARALTRLIQSDQSMAGHVLRISNSAAYSPVTKITSLQQAIARLGLQTISEISMAATLGPKLFPAAGFETLIDEIWRSSLVTALWARELSRYARRNVETAFLCGLLCQIGRPVVLQTVLQIAHETGEELSPESVNALLDTFQVRVGSLLVEHWQLPAVVGHTISGVGGLAVEGGSKDLVDLVRAARVFAAATLAQREYNAEVLAMDPLLVEINLYPEDVSALLQRKDVIHETTGALLA